MRLLGTMSLVALVIGTSLSAAATERVDLVLVLSTSLAWGFVPVLQLLTGLVLIQGRTRLGAIGALEAYFSTHVPWSLWILSVHVLFMLVAPARDFALWSAITAVVPAVWTVRLLLQLCRARLGMSPAAARWRVLLHQVLTYGLVILYVDFAVALVPRLLA